MVWLAQGETKSGSDTVENYAIEKTDHTDIIIAGTAFLFCF